MKRTTTKPEFYTFDRKLSFEQQLYDINSKLDYVIDMIASEDLRHPYHQNYMDTYKNKSKDDRQNYY